MSENSLPGEGFSRISRVLEIIPVSRSQWYRGIAAGEYPKPVKISRNISAWRNSDILELVQKLSSQEE